MHERRCAAGRTAAVAVVFAVCRKRLSSSAPDSAWTRKTPDGQPDLRGTWVNFDSTPFEADTRGAVAADDPRGESAAALGRPRQLR